jgi:hypothetical protein
MKTIKQHPTTSLCIWVLLTVLTGCTIAGAQSNGVPGDTDYAKFSQFVADRNIFDPNRYPRTRTSTYHPRPQVHTVGAPAFTLVGTMSYQKGTFVFFDGNSPDFRKVLAAGGGIAGYTVAEVSPAAVKLAGPDKKEIVMKPGEQMRQENGTWQLAGPAEVSAASSDNGKSTAPAAGESVAPSPSLEANDVLKRLMEKRAQELK